MGKHDFPEEWPDLITILAQNLTGIDPDKLISTLYTLDELCKKYRYEVKSNRLWQELIIVLQAVSLCSSIANNFGMTNASCFKFCSSI